MPIASCSIFVASLFRGSPLLRPGLSMANTSATKKSTSELNKSPTNWFASPKRFAVKSRLEDGIVDAAVESLAISRRKRWRESPEIQEEVVATSPILNRAGLWQPSNWIYTGGPWICIGRDHKGVFIKWRPRYVWS